MPKQYPCRYIEGQKLPCPIPDCQRCGHGYPKDAEMIAVLRDAPKLDVFRAGDPWNPSHVRVMTDTYRRVTWAYSGGRRGYSWEKVK